MNTLFEWPALHLDSDAPLMTIEHERAVWGKVHGAPTDFRWIARSAGFGRGGDPASQFNLGAEDMPANFFAWRVLNDRCYAVHAYPSRASDAAGRRGFLEKQILEWVRPAGVPAALGALALLSKVAVMDDAIWWDRISGDLGMDADAFLSIDGGELESIALDEERIAIVVERGRQELRDSVGSQSLTNFYDQILGGTRPAILAGVSAPLSAAAFAVLLLPLPRTLADVVSFAGWVPSTRTSFADLARRWDLIVGCDAPLSAAQRPSERAWLMAENLLSTEGYADLNDLDVVTDDELDAPGELIVEGDDSVPLGPAAPLTLTAPDAQCGALMHELFAFARSPERRWLDPGKLTRARNSQFWAQPRNATALLTEWVQAVGNGRPPYANLEQWNVKVDLLRSAAVCLVPDSQLVRTISLPAPDSRVPSLLFALQLQSRHERDSLLRIGETALRQAMLQSLTCRGSARYGLQIRAWLKEWSRNTGHPEVRALVTQALAP
ncbi:MAG TPA: hypothetical protein VHW00_20010 [Thermoanaerobaculia bacterium]|nr:hypothetical protein [Thermoanaerobaculia bacterium]